MEVDLIILATQHLVDWGGLDLPWMA